MQTRTYFEDGLQYDISYTQDSSGTMIFNYVAIKKGRDGREHTKTIVGQGMLKRAPRGAEGTKWQELLAGSWQEAVSVPDAVRQCWTHTYQEPEKEGRIRKVKKNYVDLDTVADFLLRRQNATSDALH